MLSSSPSLENPHKKYLDVLYRVDPDNECIVQVLQEFDREELKSTTKEGFDLGAENDKNKLEEPELRVRTVDEVDDRGACRQGSKDDCERQNRRFTPRSENVGVWLVRSEPDALEHDRVEEGGVARQVR